jgi:L-cystine uptake protein TcyP (sodium:dicarboxylate symporter family)
MTILELFNEATTLASKIGYDGSVDPLRNIVFHPIVGNVFYSLLTLYYFALITSSIISGIFNLNWYKDWNAADVTGVTLGVLFLFVTTTLTGIIQYILWLAMFIWPFWIFIGLLYLIKYRMTIYKGILSLFKFEKKQPITSKKSIIEQYKDNLLK